MLFFSHQRPVNYRETRIGRTPSRRQIRINGCVMPCCLAGLCCYATSRAAWQCSSPGAAAPHGIGWRREPDMTVAMVACRPAESRRAAIAAEGAHRAAALAPDLGTPSAGKPCAWPPGSGTEAATGGVPRGSHRDASMTAAPPPRGAPPHNRNGRLRSMKGFIRNRNSMPYWMRTKAASRHPLAEPPMP
jgi:hypothetical protein